MTLAELDRALVVALQAMDQAALETAFVNAVLAGYQADRVEALATAIMARMPGDVRSFWAAPCDICPPLN